MKKYRVNEIFFSVQGEGQWVGQPMVFVRLAGCNLHCSFCDTEFDKFTEMTAEEIRKKAEELWFGAWKEPTVESVPLVRFHLCLTGGEPTMQLDRPLVETLGKEGWKLHLETNGTRDILFPGKFECVTVSPKAGLSKRMRDVWTRYLGSYSRIGSFDLKVVWDLSDQKLLAKIIDQWAGLPWGRRFIQPCALPDGTFDPQPALDFVLKNPLWSLSLQTQKILKIR